MRTAKAVPEERTGDEMPVRSTVGIALVAVSGIVALPGLAEPYLLPKATAAALGATLILSAPRRYALPRSITWVLVAAAVVLVISALMSCTPISSFWGRYPRYEGAWVLTVYWGALVAGARVRTWPQARRRLDRVLAASAAVVALGAILQWVGLGSASRVTSLLGNASELGTWGAIVAAALAIRALKRQPIGVLGFAAGAVSVVLSGSRGALLGLVAGLLVVGMAASRRSKASSGSWGWSVLGALTGVAVLALLIPTTRGRLLGEGLAEATVVGRELLWRDTWHLVLANPVLGVGPSSFVDEVGAFHSLAWAADVGPVNPPDSPHSLVLQILVAGGVALLAICVLGAALWLRDARRSATTHFEGTLSATAAIVAGLTAMATHFTSAATVPLMALLAGWVVGCQIEGVPTPHCGSDLLGKWMAPLATAAAFLVLAAATAAESPIGSALASTSQGDIQSASSAWRRARLARPWDSDLIMREGHATAYAAAVGLAPAEVCLLATGEAVRRLPRSSEAAQDRASCLDANGEFAAAQEVLTRALAFDPVNVNLLLLSGVVAVHDSDLPAAEERFRDAAALRPIAPEPWANLATVYDRMGRGKAADQARQRAAELAGDSGPQVGTD